MQVFAFFRLAPFLILPLMVAACGFNPPSVNDYDRSCSSDDECTTVTNGCECLCASGALRQSEAEDFRAAARTNCFGVPILTDCLCRLVDAKCIENQCEMVDLECESDDCEVYESL